jgi:hypothetical protein
VELILLYIKRFSFSEYVAQFVSLQVFVVVTTKVTVRRVVMPFSQTYLLKF